MRLGRVEVLLRVEAGPEDLGQTLLAAESWQDAPKVTTAPMEKYVNSVCDASKSDEEEEPLVSRVPGRGYQGLLLR